jgi:putative glycerol-1-phosphate prenyltransferase
MLVYQHLINTIDKKGAAYLMLVDPDKFNFKRIRNFINKCEDSGVDAFLVGGSLLINGQIDRFITQIKEYSKLPVVIFPGTIDQVTSAADAILYISVISGRNSEHLIGKHVVAAPIIKNANLEVISTGYMLIESGVITTAQYMSGSLPIPRTKIDIAAATALAAEYLGMKFVYLEAGSGADYSVPNEMISAVSGYINIPVIVGGGIRNPGEAREKVERGARLIVTGNYFENENNWEMIRFFADAIHIKNNVEV